ncbi:MAG TPA: hypothetical protein VE709_00735, partial [Pseudonocardiaceae bacterium]|nr:hypothetical protein [Pseudonocardiaceae bacterium]
MAKRITGMSLSAANSATALRNRSPMRSKIAGEGIGNPRCRVRKLTTCPGTCRVGTQPPEVDPVKALQIQTNMPVEDVVHRHQPLRHHDHLRTAAS